MSEAEAVEVRDNVDASRYEIFVDGVLAGSLTYTIKGDVVTTPHTEIDPAFGGRGLAGILVKHALDLIRDSGMTVRPLCPFVAAYIRKHPEYQDLVRAR